MSFFKYYNERQDADGERLWWPGGPDGFPYRGAVPPQTTKDEYENLRLAGKARSRLFRLDNPDDYKDYVAVRDKCVNGLYTQLDRDRVWDEEAKHYRIYLEWVELSYETPPMEDVKNGIPTPQPTQGLPYGRLAGVAGNSPW